MLGSAKKAGRIAIAAAAMVAAGSSASFASGGWDPQYAMLGQGGQCEQFNIRIDDNAHCSGSHNAKICEYSLNFGNTTKGYARITVMLNSQLPPGYQLLLPNPHHVVSLKPHQWGSVKVLRTSAAKPPMAALVSVDCTLAMP
ncbi:MAG TPA: hypothetical protein VG651_25515 [Stellaceae bacterium]|nr:hypothetical protein [Stellaceae bacterium]